MRRPPNPLALVVRAAIVLVVVALAATAFLPSGRPAAAWAPRVEPATWASPAAEPLPTPSTPDPSTSPPTTSPGEPATAPADEPGIGGLDTGANSPSPRGEAAPPRSQRIADTLIAVGLLAVLVVGVAVAIWSSRRRRPAA